MDRVTLLAHSLRFVMAGLRRLRVGPPASMSASEVAGNAQGLSYAILATHWQRRARVPPWPQVYAAWERRIACGGGVEPSLFGEFNEQDRWELLTDNAQAFRRRDELFQSARRSIDLSTYYIQA